eukprot:5768926-Ditylum_brightwellii.AAC.1
MRYLLRRGGVHDEVRHACNILMGQKGLDPSAIANIQQLQVLDYIAFTCLLQDSTEEDAKRIKEIVQKLALTCYDFNYSVDSAP